MRWGGSIVLSVPCRKGWVITSVLSQVLTIVCSIFYGLFLQVCVRVTAHCGTPDLRYQGQMNIYEESLNRGGPGATQPTRVITFANISDVTALNSAVPAPFSSSPSRDSPFSLSLELSSQQRIRQLWGFMLLLVTGEALEMFSESQAQQQLWVKHLALLAMFPYSPIPEEPRVNPIRDGFRARLNPANFNAGVCVCLV